MKIKNKYLIVHIIFTILMILMISCSKKESANNTNSNLQTKKEILIGISKIVKHPALDAIEKGIIDAINDGGISNVKFDLQNANGDINTAMQIANKFKSEKVDLAIGIATPTAQAIVNTIQNTPIIYSAVTDPVSAGIITSTVERQKREITGISDMTPVKQQIETLLKIKNVKRIGNIYNSNESNSITIANIFKKVCEEKGIEPVFATVTNSAEVKQAILSLINRVDAIYLGNDNTVFSAINSILEVVNKNKIPLITADPSSAEKYPVLASLGFNYYNVGYKTGKLVVSYLSGKDIFEKPVYYMTEKQDLDLILNQYLAKQIGIAFSNDLLSSATRVIDKVE